MRERPEVSMDANVTALLVAWGQGDQSALERLIPIVHSELHRLAQGYMAGEREGHTLRTTALVNEAYLRLVECRRVGWQDRTHFLAVSASLMRRILVDFARTRNYQKRGGGARPIELIENLDLGAERTPDLVALDDALEALAQVDARKSKVVQMKFFGGMETEEIAAALEVSPQTVLRDWKMAKAWLTRELKRGDEDGR